MVGGVSTMFLFAQKIALQRDIFENDDHFIMYFVYIFYIQLKTITISFISYRAYSKAKLVHRLCSQLFNILGNIELLQIETEVVKLGCGFFNFDWDLFIIVRCIQHFKNDEIC
ncbi:hypothetical protein ACKWTF_006546 [Chironomus riparius]